MTANEHIRMEIPVCQSQYNLENLTLTNVKNIAVDHVWLKVYLEICSVKLAVFIYSLSQAIKTHLHTLPRPKI